MLKYTFLLVLFLFTSNLSFTQPKKVAVSGIVKTLDGKPAEFISVYLKNTFYGATTDENGRFIFKAPVGEYTMTVYSIAAHAKEFPISIKENTENNFPDITIREKSTELDQVVVTGQFSPQSLRKSVYKVRLINAQQIEQKSATNVQSLLNTEIGVRLSNDMALGETDFELMGMSGNNVKVLIDGIPVIDRGPLKQSLNQIDVNSIQQVEIVEGPLSVIYGTDALAGVINIITKKANISKNKTNFSLSLKAQEESFGDEYNFFKDKGSHEQNAFLTLSLKNGLYTQANFNRNTSGGWVGDKIGREKQWLPKDQYIYAATLGYKVNNFNVWYRLNYVEEKITRATNPELSNPKDKIYTQTDKDYLVHRYNHQLQSIWKINNQLDVEAVVSYQDYNRRTRTTVENIETGAKWLSLDESAQDTSKMKSWFARSTVTWRLNQNLSFQPGIEYQWQKAAGGRIKGEPNMENLAIFLSAEWVPISWLNVRPGLRSILKSDYNAPVAIPSLMTKLSISHSMDLRLSYAYGFRAPTLRELYFSFHNANHNIDGNPDLKSEYSNNFSASYVWRALHTSDFRLTSTLTGFYNDFQDRIITAMDKNDPTHTTYYNVSSYKTTGGTLENSFTWYDFKANVGFSLVGRYNNLVDNEKYKDLNLPKFRFSPEVTVNASYELKTGTSFSLFYKFTGERKEYFVRNKRVVNESEVYLAGVKGFSWADFTVSQKLLKYLILNAGVKNIFNIKTVTNTIEASGHSTSNGSVFVGCGRSYFVGLNFTFNN